MLGDLRHSTLVCSLEEEPIDGDRPVQWMRELFPQHRVIHVRDENPSYPYQHPEFWNLWTSTIRRAAGDFDVLFTSEDYGDELAQRLGAEHHCVDGHRLRFPISGTAIRRDPMRHWDFLPHCVRPHFAKRVVIIGSECTGKTTVAQALARHYATEWLPE